MLLCPVCHEPLVDDERGAACAGGHRFDRAREGYLYLLRSSKSGDSMGDPKSQARSRRDFLNRGYYAPLRDAMVELVRERVSERAASTGTPVTLLDICCGEGYYTSAMGAVPGADAYGFDLGKEMVRLAAKRGDARAAGVLLKMLGEEAPQEDPGADALENARKLLGGIDSAID